MWFYVFLNRFEKVEKVAKIDQKGKGLVFAGFLLLFQLFKNGSKKPRNTSPTLKNCSKRVSLCFRKVTFTRTKTII